MVHSITKVVYRSQFCVYFEDTPNRISRQNCTGIWKDDILFLIKKFILFFLHEQIEK